MIPNDAVIGVGNILDQGDSTYIRKNRQRKETIAPDQKLLNPLTSTSKDRIDTTLTIIMADCVEYESEFADLDAPRRIGDVNTEAVKTQIGSLRVEMANLLERSMSFRSEVAARSAYGEVSSVMRIPPPFSESLEISSATYSTSIVLLYWLNLLKGRFRWQGRLIRLSAHRRNPPIS